MNFIYASKFTYSIIFMPRVLSEYHSHTRGSFLGLNPPWTKFQGVSHMVFAKHYWGHLLLNVLMAKLMCLFIKWLFYVKLDFHHNFSFGSQYPKHPQQTGGLKFDKKCKDVSRVPYENFWKKSRISTQTPFWNSIGDK